MEFRKVDKVDEVWEYLLASNKRIVSSQDVFEAAKARGFKERSILQLMVRKTYLLPSFFKGVYIIRTAQEYLAQTIGLTSQKMIVMLLNYKFDSNWYFGLESAHYF